MAVFDFLARDVDNNGFPDLGIGAPGKENSLSSSNGLVIAVRMRPLVHITASLFAYEYDPTSMIGDLEPLTYIDILSGNTEECGTSKTVDGEDVAFCFYLQTCFTYHPSHKSHPRNEELDSLFMDATGNFFSRFKNGRAGFKMPDFCSVRFRELYIYSANGT